ncbi:MAG: dTMP kinase [Archangiaceae bacterium]|nr:dTMP kinase [Archangiaceae bacterium]
MLIAFEGIDGSGKSTQAARLAEALRADGSEVVLTKEPTDGPWGKKLRQSFVTARMTAKDELDCFLSDRREHVEQLIRPALNRGATVIVDRYYWSTVVYQGMRGLDPAEVLKLNEAFAPRPDVTFLVDVDPHVALERISGRAGGRDLLENLEVQLKVREAFTALARTQPGFILIDGALPEGAMQAQVRSRLAAWRTGAVTSPQS